MNFYDVLQCAADNAGVSLGSIGRALGNRDNYVYNGRTRGSIPRCDTAAAMLAVCGYVLAAVPAASLPSDALILDAPTSSEEKQAAAVARKRAKLLAELEALGEE